VNFYSKLLLLADESKAFGLDITWWTAIATMVALALGLLGIFGPAIVSRLCKPKLELVFDKLSKFSEVIQGNWCLRLPVSNRTGRRSTTAIEVFLESIRHEHVKNPRPLPTYLPVRLLWTHERKPVCDRIAGGAYRLLDFGYLVFTPKVTPASELDSIADTRPDALAIDTEIYPSSGRLELAVGSYIIGFLVTSDSSVKRYRFKFTISDQPFEPKAKLKRYLQIEPA